MGNTPSSTSERAAVAKEGGRRDSRRRESINALSPAISKSAVAPPSASLESATAHGSTIKTIPIATQPQDVPIIDSHNRARSQTVATPRLQPQDIPTSNLGPKRAVSASGSTGHTAPESEAARLSDVNSASPLAAANLSDAYHLPPPSYSRPPRLPLPIEEEFQAPGSPIVSHLAGQFGANPDEPGPDEFQHQVGNVGGALDDGGNGADGDDDESDNDTEADVDAEGFLGGDDSLGMPKVPTVVEYREAAPGERVYVTGTFTDWRRKFRLHPNGPSKNKGVLSTTLQLQPGTHHIKFLVKDDMVCSNFLPTTVDYTNILVNYLEVLPVDPNTVPTPVQPLASTPTAVTRPLDIRTTTPVRSQAGTGAGPGPAAGPSSARASPITAQNKDQPKAARVASPAFVRQPPKNYTQTIPPYLVDLDSWVPEDGDESSDKAVQSRYNRANAATHSLPAPPSLPLFLSKSILNGTTPVKDDASVLPMPNHTVLNHLTTSNIKQQVLATSGTTRIKKKFLTTIFYKAL